jgi:IclR family pca regulon transcriptional regulator
MARSSPDRGAVVPADEPPADRLFIGSIGKCFQVLEALNAAGRPTTLTALAAAAGLDRSATQRITHTLGRLGYLRQHPESRAWSLGTRLLEFGHTVLANDRLRECALPLLEALNERTGETVNLMELEGREIVYVARFPSRHAVSVDLHVGSRLPAYCTAAGRAILARLRDAQARELLAASTRTPMTERTVTDLPSLLKLLVRARTDGYCVNDQEAFVGDLSVAAAIADRTGHPVGAINIAVPTPRWQRRALERELAPLVVATARDISQEYAAASRSTGSR